MVGPPSMHGVTVPSALTRCAAVAGWKIPEGGQPSGRSKPELFGGVVAASDDRVVAVAAVVLASSVGWCAP